MNRVVRIKLDIYSPEVLLTFFIPLIFIYYSLINGIESGYMIIYGLIVGAYIFDYCIFEKYSSMVFGFGTSEYLM